MYKLSCCSTVKLYLTKTCVHQISQQLMHSHVSGISSISVQLMWHQRSHPSHPIQSTSLELSDGGLTNSQARHSWWLSLMVRVKVFAGFAWALAFFCFLVSAAFRAPSALFIEIWCKCSNHIFVSSTLNNTFSAVSLVISEEGTFLYFLKYKVGFHLLAESAF